MSSNRNHITGEYIETLIQRKRDKYVHLVESIRRLCDAAINRGVTKGQLPIVFKVPRKKIALEHKEFSIESIIADLAESLKRDDFYVQQTNQQKPHVLSIYPRCIVKCSFLNIPQESISFVRQIQSVESKKPQQNVFH